MRNSRWFYLIGKKFFRIVPSYTILSIAFTSFSKLTRILASFLPLKVVILLGSSGVPRYFPDSFQLVDRDTLVINLCAATVIFYLLYMLSEKLLNKLTVWGAESISLHTRKMPLFENQSTIIQKGFQRYSQSLAEFFFLSIGLVVLGLLYPSVLLVMAAYGIIAVVFVRVFSIVVHSTEEDENTKSMLVVLFDVGFLIVFVFMIYQALNGNGPSILVMFLTFILVRQFQASLKKVIVNLIYLVKQHVQISALFFDKQDLIPQKTSHQDLFWALAEPASVHQWAGVVIERLTQEKPDQLICRWFQLDTSGVQAYRVSVGNVNKGSDEYLIKLFGKKQHLSAQHESEIMMQISELPSLKLLAVDEVQGFYCHLFEWQDGKTPTHNEENQSQNDLNESLMKVIPPSLFLEKYLRSHPLLMQRLDKKFWEHVSCVGDLMDEKKGNNIKLLLELTDVIHKRLSSLPLTIINPELSRSMLLKTVENTVLALHWTQWSIEPMGAGWSIKDRNANLFDKATKTCADINQRINNSDLGLAALLYAFENLIKRQDFNQASELISDILACLERE